MYKLPIVTLLLALTSVTLSAQSGMQRLPLDDLSAFRNQAGNWRIVGNVSFNPFMTETPQPIDAPSRKKKTKTEPALPTSPLSYSAGNGILLNINDDKRKDHLITTFEHGDIELELEVMLMKGSNSGIYLQGRYEIQLLDSWGVKNATFSDMGGIYRNWESTPDQIYMGKSPLTNAAKAPGLWQTLKIGFQAPRFDKEGNKITNARFTSVELNGIKIHDNVEVPLPTGGPIEKNEKPLGPLMIQGDHGVVAIRNMRYKLMKPIDVTISPVAYQVYHGTFESFEDVTKAKAALSGTSAELTSEVTDIENDYAIRYTGTISVPEEARYKFLSRYTGAGKLSINNQPLFTSPTPDGRRADTASIVLQAGTYPFEFINHKTASWLPPRLALLVSTSNSYLKPLHALNSYPPADKPTSSIFINPGREPKLFRAFIDFKGNRGERLTHTIGVGDPGGIHYVYDLKAGNLVCVWRGDFVDATPMWHDRGDGSFRPLGAALYLYNQQALAYINLTNAFPKVSKEDEWRGKGYTIDEATSRPVFHYQYRGLSIEDQVVPEQNNTVVTHTITIKEGEPEKGLHYKLAEGTAIEMLSEGVYAVDDKQYYIHTKSPGVSIRDVDGKKELIAPVSGKSVQYSIIW